MVIFAVIEEVCWRLITYKNIRHGDIHPGTTREMIFDIFYMLFNLGMTSYLIGNMTSLVVNRTSRTRQFDTLSKWPPLRPLSLILKVYLQQRELNEVYSGGISSYALLTMLMS